MTTLMKQNTASPTRKVNFAGLGTILATIIAAAGTATGVPYLVTFFGYPGLEAAFGGGLAVAFAYFAQERL